MATIIESVARAWRERKPRAIAWGTKGGLAVLEYGMISGSNFLASVMLARWLTPPQYGAYASAFAIFLLFLLLCNALVLEPVSVYGSADYRNALRNYLRKLLWMTTGLGLLSALALAGAAGVLYWTGLSTHLSSALAGLAIATPGWLLFALGRRMFYIQLSPGPAAASATVYVAILAAGLFLLHGRGILTTFTAFVLIGVAATLTGAVLLARLAFRLPGNEPAPSIWVLSRQHWKYGSWAFGSSIANWAPAYIYFPLLSTFFGSASAGELKALMNFNAPLSQSYAAFSMLLLPWAARTHARKGACNGRALGWRVLALFVASAIAYWAVLLPFSGRVFQLLYAGKYAGVSWLLPWFAFEALLVAAFNGPSTVLRAMKDPRSVFIANCGATAVCVVFGVIATRQLGVFGATIGMILSKTTALIIALVLLSRRSARQEPATELATRESELAVGD